MAYNQFPERPDESVGSWMLTLLLCGIPVVGFIYLLVLAFGSGLRVKMCVWLGVSRGLDLAFLNAD